MMTVLVLILLMSVQNQKIHVLMDIVQMELIGMVILAMIAAIAQMFLMIVLVPLIQEMIVVVHVVDLLQVTVVMVVMSTMGFRGRTQTDASDDHHERSGAKTLNKRHGASVD